MEEIREKLQAYRQTEVCLDLSQPSLKVSGRHGLIRTELISTYVFKHEFNRGRERRSPFPTLSHGTQAPDTRKSAPVAGSERVVRRSPTKKTVGRTFSKRPFAAITDSATAAVRCAQGAMGA